MSHGGLTRARSWKRRIQPKEAYSSPGLLYSESCDKAWLRQLDSRLTRAGLQQARMATVKTLCFLGIGLLISCPAASQGRLPLSLESIWLAVPDLAPCSF